MTGSAVPPPPPPPPPSTGTVPPSHEVVVDATQAHTTSHITVDLSHGQPTVFIEGAGDGRAVTQAPERAVRKSTETAEPID